ncbi:uncharacterized protein L3040_003275 [Drepanopeziza brunnea f. sp. 'multigermtubi']|uniref:uncharacterized protein n=1 Tax=Drepanopeziza brunnea f. sp. 'multigermtubi' TaxID=698441 RepID=UPI0023866B41|nr:hypothetical protein L3040_003275 [Drepanopeziza brunnea f. sp. 'multigermtubi']
MRFSTSSLLLAATTLLGTAVAHNIQLAAHGRECFHEMLHKDDKMTVTFQVGDREFGSAGNLQIDFWIQNPAGGFEVQQLAVMNGDHSFTAQHDGKYIYCFIYVPEADAPSDPLELEVRHLSELLSQVRDEQSYIVLRERTHRNTAESTNARVKWWSLFQMGVLVGEGIFQVWWLKRFFEVKRVV